MKTLKKRFTYKVIYAIISYNQIIQRRQQK